MSGRSSVAERRVVFVLPSLEGGGAERVSLAFLAGIRSICKDVHLVLLHKTGALRDQIPCGVQVHDLGRARLRQSLPTLVSILRRLRPDLVYSTHGYINVPLLALRPLYGRSIRLLLREANTPSASLSGQRFTQFFRGGYRLLYPHADALICQSELMADELQHDYHVPRRHLYLIRNPTDTATIRSDLRPIRVSGDGARFVAAGLFSYKKGFDRLIDWFRVLPETAHLTLLGQGPLESELRKQVASNGLNARVAFPGFLPRPWDHFAGADAFLLSSRWEGMPNVALEALACGTPVIATQEAGGITEVASMVSTDAVKLAASGEAFTAEMAAVVPSHVEVSRPSLLPTVFDLERAQFDFNRLLVAMLAGEEAACGSCT